MTKSQPLKFALDLPFAIQNKEFDKPVDQGELLRSGSLCPRCGSARLDYDGLLNLSCPNCGFSGGGGCHT